MHLFAERAQRHVLGDAIKTPTMDTSHRFTDEERCGVYRAIYERRDVRSRFVAEPLPEAVLSRILDAGHHAPSVGLMQPWAFILIADAGVRAKVREAFDAANRRAAEAYTGERRDLYDRLKLEAIPAVRLKGLVRFSIESVAPDFTFSVHGTSLVSANSYL